MSINVFYRLLFILLCVTGYAENHNKDSNIYWDWSNEFLIKAPTFVDEYFYKPLKTLSHITGDIKVLSVNFDDDLEKICNKIEGLVYDRVHTYLL